MFARLVLTPDEKQWNDYYSSSGKLGVLPRKYMYRSTLNAANQAATVYHFASRRSRIYMITWAGDVYGAKVNIYDSTGEKYTVQPCHIPLLSGHAPHSTQSKDAAIVAYPTAAQACHSPPAYNHIIEPNKVLPSNKQLVLEYTLENTVDDAQIGANTYQIITVIHAWEFPGFEGGAR